MNLELNKIIEIYSCEFNGMLYDIHVDATEQRWLMHVFCEDGRTSEDKQISNEEIDYLENIINNINN
jgi:hypothetical protein